MLLRSTELEPFRDLPLKRESASGGPAPGRIARRLERLLGEWEPDLDALDDETAALYESTVDADDRLFLRIHLAVWQDAPGFRAASGLSDVGPPEGIHAMARGPLAAGGSFGAADMVLDAIAEPSGELPPITRALDFGASSGRVVRVLATELPDVEWHACDPNEPAIRWAAEHLEGIDFFVNPQRPPLHVPDEHYDLVFAISIWSHFREDAAREWLAEMHRIVAPGGLLVFTTQGFATTARLAHDGEWTPVDINEAIATAFSHGHHFHSIFGAGGDHGVVDHAWGWATVSPEWMLCEVTPAWAVRRFGPAHHEQSQDIWVLERRGAGP